METFAFYVHSSEDKPSKVDILRGLVTDRMTTAVREILAVVETTVVGYESEVSSLKRELDRHKRQLDAILQPQVNLYREDKVDLSIENKDNNDNSISESAGMNESDSVPTNVVSQQEMVSLEHKDGDTLEDPPHIDSSVSDPVNRDGRHFEVEINEVQNKDSEIKRTKQSSAKYKTSQTEIDTDDDENNVIEKSQPPQRSSGTNDSNSVPTSEQEMVSLEDEDGDTLEDLPGDSSVFGPANRDRRRSKREINDVKNKDSENQRRKRIPRRYRSSQTETDTDGDESNVFEYNCGNEWRPRQNNKSSNRKKQHLIKLRIAMLNCQDAELSNKAFRYAAPVKMIKCQRNLSESAFLSMLRATFPKLRENKQFEAFLYDCRNRLPLSENGMTPTELYEALRSTEKRHFAFHIKLKHEDKNKPSTSLMEEQSKEHEDTMTMSSHDDNKPSMSSCNSLMEEQPSETRALCKSTDETDKMSSADSAAQSEEDEEDDVGDDDDDWTPEQNDKEEVIDAPRSEKKIIAHSRKNSTNFDPCKVCGILFKSKTVLTKHVLTQHLDNPKSLCGVCGQQLQSSEELRSHLDTHQKFHQCDTCGQYFVTVTSLQKHMVTHVTEKLFRCSICQKAFAHEKLLKRHKLEHEDKPYKCDTCPQSFIFKSQLNTHNVIHMHDKPYICDICGKSLTNFRSFSRHKQNHMGQKSYSCQYCGKLFVCPRKQKDHEKIHATREKNYLCDICSKSFYTLTLLKYHKIRHEEKHILICPVCSKPIKGTLIRHMRIHNGEKPFSCSVCGSKFSMKSNLDIHMRSHEGIKPFTCKVCGKACVRQHHLDVHMRTHTGEKPYKCSLCDKAFTQSHCLKTHMNSHKGEQ